MDHNNIIGTWKLISFLVTTVGDENRGGEVRKPLGENASGFLTYTDEGRMMAMLASSGRPPLSVADLLAAPAAERAEAFATFVAYAGSYKFDGDRVTHHVELSLFQNWVGTDQIRFAKLHGNRLTLSTPPILAAGEQVVMELVWERLNDTRER